MFVIFIILTVTDKIKYLIIKRIIIIQKINIYSMDDLFILLINGATMSHF